MMFQPTQWSRDDDFIEAMRGTILRGHQYGIFWVSMIPILTVMVVILAGRLDGDYFLGELYVGLSEWNGGHAIEDVFVGVCYKEVFWYQS